MNNFIHAAIYLLIICINIPNAEDTIPDYKRSEFGWSWADVDKDGLNTRHELLVESNLADSANTKYNYDSSRITDGTWVCHYSKDTVYKSRALDIDHYIPLKEAWVSGAWKWDKDKRILFANDLHGFELLPVKLSLNRSKGSKDPAHWLPEVDTLKYISKWLYIKLTYGLEMDDEEKEFIRTYLRQYR